MSVGYSSIEFNRVASYTEQNDNVLTDLKKIRYLKKIEFRKNSLFQISVILCKKNKNFFLTIKNIFLLYGKI